MMCDPPLAMRGKSPKLNPRKLFILRGKSFLRGKYFNPNPAPFLV